MRPRQVPGSHKDSDAQLGLEGDADGADDVGGTLDIARLQLVELGLSDACVPRRVLSKNTRAHVCARFRGGFASV